MTRSAPGPHPLPPPPADAPLLTLAEAAAYLRLSVPALRKIIEGRADVRDDTLGAALRPMVVRLSPHRRYLRREPFLAYLRNGVGMSGGRAAS